MFFVEQPSHVETIVQLLRTKRYHKLLSLYGNTKDKDKCITEFDNCCKKEKALITWIKAHKIKVLNSGIKIA